VEGMLKTVKGELLTVEGMVGQFKERSRHSKVNIGIQINILLPVYKLNNQRNGNKKK